MKMKSNESKGIEGILLIDKPRGQRSFNLVRLLRKRLGVQKIGHAGTLDPFATGVMVMLIGKKYTQKSNSFLNADKEYTARILLGVSTDSYDCDGKETRRSDYVPTLEELEKALQSFQGEIQQVPPIFSAKKREGKKLYELARAGKSIECTPIPVTVSCTLIHYAYPYIDLAVSCSKGTYVRSIAHDLGNLLGCGGHLSELVRTRSGSFTLDKCLDGALLEEQQLDPSKLIDNLIAL